MDRTPVPDRHRASASRWLRRVAPACAAALALTLALAGCGSFPSTDGDTRADRAAEGVADEIGSHSENTPRITLPEMIAWWVPEGPVPAGPGTAVVEPLAWSGESAGSQAMIDIRVKVDVPAQSATTIGGESWGAGSATRCFRLEWRQYEEAERSEIPCPDDPAPARPTPAPRPELNQADQDRVMAILAETPEFADVEPALREAFPQDFVTIETDRADGGVVVAVGIPAERECILALRDGTGAITFPGYRQISLEPGEIGCSTHLYTNPPF